MRPKGTPCNLIKLVFQEKWYDLKGRFEKQVSRKAARAPKKIIFRTLRLGGRISESEGRSNVPKLRITLWRVSQGPFFWL
jgi:hypothetical protein